MRRSHVFNILPSDARGKKEKGRKRCSAPLRENEGKKEKLAIDGFVLVGKRRWSFLGSFLRPSMKKKRGEEEKRSLFRHYPCVGSDIRKRKRRGIEIIEHPLIFFARVGKREGKNSRVFLT